MMDSNHTLLKSHFAQFEDPAWEQVGVALTFREIAAMNPLFKEGDAAEGLYLIVKGRFAVQVNAGFVEKKQTVAILSEGSIIGEASLAGVTKHSLRVVAVEHGVVAVLSREKFEELERQTPQIAIALLKHALSIAHLRLVKNSERLGLVL